MKRRFVATRWSPAKLYLVILLVVFACEFLVMLLVPQARALGWPDWAVGMLDAGVLTLLLVPAFGWLIIQPLAHMATVRAHLLAQMIVVQEQERGRIARDLHDEIGQSFTLVLLRLRTLDLSAGPQYLRGQVEKLAELVAQTLDEIRRLARGLRPAVLDHLGLVQAVAQYIEEFQRAHPIQVELLSQGLEGKGRVSAPIETAVYRIVQEALTNIARHSCARRIRMSLRRAGGCLELKIDDDGRGLPASRPTAGQSAGLVGMSERAALLHGTLRVSSAPDNGTRLVLTIPLAEGSAA